MDGHFWTIIVMAFLLIILAIKSVRQENRIDKLEKSAESGGTYAGAVAEFSVSQNHFNRGIVEAIIKLEERIKKDV